MTSTPAMEQGAAVALSVGGRAQTLAQQLPVQMILHPRGLANLLYVLEANFGPEDQDLQEDALDQWERLMRGRGQSIGRCGGSLRGGRSTGGRDGAGGQVWVGDQGRRGQCKGSGVGRHVGRFDIPS